MPRRLPQARSAPTSIDDVFIAQRRRRPVQWTPRAHRIALYATVALVILVILAARVLPVYVVVAK